MEGNKNFQMRGNGKNASFWGIRGKEEINSTTKVFFELEAFLNAENGIVPQDFNRSSYLGIENSKWGTIIAGRQKSAAHLIMSQFDIGQDNATSYSSRNTNLYIGGFAVDEQDLARFNSTLTYYTPRMHGTRVGFSYVSKHDNSLRKADEDARNIYNVAVDYKLGGLTAGVAYQSRPYQNNTDTTKSRVNGALGVAAKYDFQNNFSLAAGYLDNHIKEEGRGYFIGASYITGPYKFGGQLAHNTYKGEDGRKPFAFSMYARYSLSKRSDFYALWGIINNDAKAVLNAEHKNSFIIGMRHKF